MHSQYITNEMLLQTSTPNLLRIVCVEKKIGEKEKKIIMKERKKISPSESNPRQIDKQFYQHILLQHI